VVSGSGNPKLARQSLQRLSEIGPSKCNSLRARGHIRISPAAVVQRRWFNGVIVIVAHDLGAIPLIELLQVDTDEVSPIALTPAHRPLVLVRSRTRLRVYSYVRLSFESSQDGIPHEDLRGMVRDS